MGTRASRNNLNMSDSLSTYLHDHLAGSNFAIELLEGLRDHYHYEELGVFAAALLVDVLQDKEVLQGISDRVGSSHLDLKQAAAWLSEKASKVKLGHDDKERLGTFEALETLELGISGKLALWQILPVIATIDSRVPALDFSRLAARAQEQIIRVEQHRKQVALSAFALHRKLTQPDAGL
jgi:hypothetical protein